MEHQLDGFDVRILAELSEHGRMNWSDLADRIGLSQTPTIRRVRALEASGLIAGYRAVLDEARLGAAVSVFVSVSLSTQTDEALVEFETSVAGLPAVMDCFMVAGSIDYLLRAVVPDLTGYQAFISELTRVPGVARISSSFAVKSVVQRAAPPLPQNFRPGGGDRVLRGD